MPSSDMSSPFDNLLVHACATQASRTGRALFRREFETPLAYRARQQADQLVAVFPPEAAIGDALTVDEFLARDQILPARLQMTFHHHAENAVLAAGDLREHVFCHVSLLLIALLAVGMDEMHHQ